MINYAVVIPMANEEKDFIPFINILTETLNKTPGGSVYFIVDNVSKDRTLEMCNQHSAKDHRFKTVWAPQNRNVVDAYMNGYKEALQNGHEYIIEMDAGLSHDPRMIPQFLESLCSGYECVFGSRFIKGGGITDSNWKRFFLSKVGTILANTLLGTSMYDMTSGFQGFHAGVVKKFAFYPLLSKAHFYQTELRYLLRHSNYIEIPIQYRAPSPSVSKKAIINSLSVLFYYFKQRLKTKSVCIQ